MSDAERWARLFHDTYETLAPEYGYETRPETREFDPTSSNGRLMMAVCANVVAELLASQAAEIKWLKGQTSVYDALKVQINSRDTLIASQAAEIAALKAEIAKLTGRDTMAPRDVTALYRKYESEAAEIERLREKVRLARMLSARLHLIHDDGRYVSVWTLSANAGRPYNGPTYEAELAALDAVLTPEERQP